MQNGLYKHNAVKPFNGKLEKDSTHHRWMVGMWLLAPPTCTGEAKREELKVRQDNMSEILVIKFKISIHIHSTIDILG